MSIYSDVEDGIYNGVKVALSEYPTVPVAFSHTSMTEPAESYVTINVLRIDEQGRQSSSTKTNEDSELLITSSYEVFVQFTFIGSKSTEMIQSFTQRLGSNPVAHQEFRRNKLGFMRKSQIRRVPQKRDTKWIDYCTIDAYFSYSVATQQIVDTIETVILQDLITGEVFTVPPTPITIP